MREILFRGKRTDNGKWVEGFYLYTNENTQPVIIDMECCSNVIIPETVGQYIGVTDKNGRKIFEGDIVEYGGTHHQVVFEKRCGNAYFGIVMSEIETWGFSNATPANGMEVIGNIHDNPEMIGGEQ